METLDYDHAIFSNAQQEADKNLAVRFYSRPVKDESKSLAEGRPIFVDTDMIEIRVRGDRNNVVHKPVAEEHKARFRAAWDAYKRGQDIGAEGTPLAEWPTMSASMVEEMKYLGFYTVEQLASASDSVCGKFPGVTTLKNKARLFIEYSKDAAPIEKFSKRLEELESQRQVDDRAKADLSQKLDELTRKYNELLEKTVATKVK